MRAILAAIAVIPLTGSSRATEPLQPPRTTLAASAPAGESGMHYKFAQGESLCCTMEQTISVELTYANGVKEKNTQSHSEETTWTVQKVDLNGTAHLFQRLTGVQGTGTPAFTPVIGLGFELDISRRGEPLAARIPKDTRESMSKESVSPPMRALFNEDGIKAMAMDRLMQFPAEKVEATKSWTVVHQFGENRLIRVYTPMGLESFEGKRAMRIGMTEEVKIDPRVRKANTEDVKTDFKDHPGVGVVYFDAVEGRLLQKTLETPTELIIHRGDGDIVQKGTEKMKVRFTYRAANDASK
jgi:hypothetical protein